MKVGVRDLGEVVRVEVWEGCGLVLVFFFVWWVWFGVFFFFGSVFFIL